MSSIVLSCLSISFRFISFRFHALCPPLLFSFYASLSSLRPFLSTKTACFVLRTLKKYPFSTKTAYFVLRSLKKYHLSTKSRFFVLRSLKMCTLSTK